MKRAREAYICPWEVNGRKCTKTYVMKYGVNCLRHFHRHLKDPLCTGAIKEKMMKFAKDQGIMKALQKKGHVKTEVIG